MHVLIVEDEILIAETIKLYLAERGHTTSKIAISYEEAVDALALPGIDLVLLDVRLSGERSGIDLAKYIGENFKLPFVYLTSQFDKRIIDNAKETSPQGYLTKPIQKETLWTTIEIAFDNFTKNTKKKATEKLIKIRDGATSYMIAEDSILFINSEHVYITIHTVDKMYTLRYGLKEIMADLNKEKFFQCHRSYIVNTSRVTGYDSANVFIQDRKIPISRSRKKEIAGIFA